ncbi:DNA-binding transcriptional MocR family regulator [Fontibacillus solani]|uniref:DNA-binding transcriptional MocR family regulator n=1 Tax=Fontibacillus solani TaxID=1572857 RepID=A0A7W3SQS4_9BACL|nr:PLP-dependent aminotransferase family protein [Fontibacillus solani]MBA9084338.1 DNA-binding transcriptional MocR family regulator [Fontibacillus solani]
MHKFFLIVKELEEQIVNHNLKEGDKLPSIRVLANQYHVSKSTVIRALHDLEQRHIVYSVDKSGYYLVKSGIIANEEEQGMIDFATSSPDPNIFPYLDFQHCVNKAIDTYKQDLFTYGTPQGLPSLLHIMQKQLANYQVFTNVRNLFVVSGIQQALSILTALPFPNGKRKILIEQPSYHLFIEHLITYGVPVAGIKRTSRGIDFEELEEIFKTEDIKFFYTMPRFHNPLGCSYSAEEKKKIVALAHKYDVYIVEDDYLADMEQDTKADPLYAYDDKTHVIYLKSYSKIIFPGLRIGIAVIPDSLLTAFTQYKRIQDIDSSMLSQGALEIYLKSSMFDRHKLKIKSYYEQRSRLLHAALEQQLIQNGNLFSFDVGVKSSLHTYIRLIEDVPANEVIRRLKKKSLWIEPIDKHYLPSFPKDNLLKLNVSRVRLNGIEDGVHLLIDEIRQLMTASFSKSP